MVLVSVRNINHVLAGWGAGKYLKRDGEAGCICSALALFESEAHISGCPGCPWTAGADQAPTQAAGAAGVPSKRGHSAGVVAFTPCQGVCREREGASAGAVRLPVPRRAGDLTSSDALPLPALLAVPSTICPFAASVSNSNKGLFFLQLFLTRLDGRTAKNSTASRQPCTLDGTVQSSSRPSCVHPLPSLGALAAGAFLP